MQAIHANQAASITELKKNPSRLIKDAAGQPIAILNHNVAEAYLVPSDTYERMLEMLDDYQLAELVQERIADEENWVEVDIDEL